MRGICHVPLGMTMWLCMLHKAPRAVLSHSGAATSQMHESISCHQFLRHGVAAPAAVFLPTAEDPAGDVGTLRALSERRVATLPLGLVRNTPAFLTFQTVSLLGAPHSESVPASHWDICYCPTQLNAPSSHVPRSQGRGLAITQSDVPELEMPPEDEQTELHCFREEGASQSGRVAVAGPDD